MSEQAWILDQCLMRAFRDGEEVLHVAYQIKFGDETVCAGLDNQTNRIGFLVDAANEKMKQPGYFFPDGKPT